MTADRLVDQPVGDLHPQGGGLAVVGGDAVWMVVAGEVAPALLQLLAIVGGVDAEILGNLLRREPSEPVRRQWRAWRFRFCRCRIVRHEEEIGVEALVGAGIGGGRGGGRWRRHETRRQPADAERLFFGRHLLLGLFIEPVDDRLEEGLPKQHARFHLRCGQAAPEGTRPRSRGAELACCSTSGPVADGSALRLALAL